MNKREVLGQQAIDAEVHDRMGLPPQTSIIVQGRRTIVLIRSAKAIATARSRNSSTYFMTVISRNLVAQHHALDHLKPN